MQKTLLRCILISLCALVILGLSAVFSLNAGETPAAANEVTQDAVPKYTFSQYQGQLALYERGFAMPVEIYDVYLEMLPAEEQQKVIDGISAQTDEEIQKIIEDYTS